MTLSDDLVLIGGGVVAGVVNTLAGGGSVLSVPLLVLMGVPGTFANGTNRVGILAHSAVASLRFRAAGVSGIRPAIPLLIPVVTGSVLGAYLISLVPDRVFDRLFGIVMIFLIIPMLWRRAPSREPRSPRSSKSHLLFFAIGLFGGAFQAGVGLFIVMAMAHAGYDLVRASSIKVSLNFGLTISALAVFVARGQVLWFPGLMMALGFALGAVIGVRLAVAGGEHLIRPALVASMLMLGGKMLGLY